MENPSLLYDVLVLFNYIRNNRVIIVLGFDVFMKASYEEERVLICIDQTPARLHTANLINLSRFRLEQILEAVFDIRQGHQTSIELEFVYRPDHSFLGGDGH